MVEPDVPDEAACPNPCQAPENPLERGLPQLSLPPGACVQTERGERKKSSPIGYRVLYHVHRSGRARLPDGYGQWLIFFPKGPRQRSNKIRGGEASLACLVEVLP